MHLRSLERFAFDSVLCPYNHVQMQDPRYAETFDELAAVCQERNVALQTIKSLAYRPWEGREHTAATWYEPLTEQADIDTRRELGARPTRSPSCSRPATSTCCRSCSTPPSATASARADEEMAALGLTALFT